ncbi:MAG: hypothetical protein AAF184_14160 [Pseudomonadota bacterium]
MKTPSNIASVSGRTPHLAAFSALATTGLLCALVLTAAGAAAQTPATPADPSAGVTPLTQGMRLPRRTPRPATHEELCRLLVTELGTIATHRCETVHSDKKLDRRIPYEVYRAIERAQIAPARVENSAVAVTMAVRILVTCNTDGCEVETLANCGLHADDLGDRYVEAQEILQSTGTWYDRRLNSTHCAKTETNGTASCSDYDVYKSQALAEVSATGELHAVLEADDEDDGLKALGRLDEALADVRFIPTVSADGQVVAASALVTPIHSIDSKAVGKPHCVEVDLERSKLKREYCYSEQEYHEWRPGPTERMANHRRMSDFVSMMAMWMTRAGDVIVP